MELRRAQQRRTADHLPGKWFGLCTAHGAGAACLTRRGSVIQRTFLGVPAGPL